uniref:Putative ketoacyl-ACP synthase III n=1 Tax=Davidia involucrata TaxID=16924 RepID=A0A5B7B9K8_DAVIN
MANASGLFSPTGPSLGRKIPQPIGIYRSGFCSPEGISKRVFCSSTSEGAEKLGSGVSPSKSRVPRIINKGCKLVGCGSAIPKFRVSNDDLAKFVETSDEWISVRTGIRERLILTGKESLTALAAEAGKRALQMAGVDPDDVDLVLLCTSTPDDLFGCKRYPSILEATKILRFSQLEKLGSKLRWVAGAGDDEDGSATADGEEGG